MPVLKLPTRSWHHLHTPRILLIFPCFNEARTIEKLLRKTAGGDYDTLVVDDGSSDNTAEVSSKWTNCLRLPFNLGIGGAVQAGIKYALKNNYELCIQVDGDGQHPPEEIIKLVREYYITKANLLIGSRFLLTEGFKSKFLRRIGIGLLRLTLLILFKQHITDPTSGFRLMDRKAMLLFSKQYPVDFPEPSSVALILQNKLVVRETSVIMEERTQGSSSIRGFKSAAYIIRVISQILQVRLGGVI